MRALVGAVTGGIGAGKSSAAAMFAELGARVVDSDRLARDAVAPGTPGLTAVIERFGAGILAADGSLDRGALARIVFADGGARADLEAIIHPRVRRAFTAAVSAAPAGSVVLNDIPLVRDAGEAARFDVVIVVVAGVPTRVRRLVGRGMAAADARARIRAQVSDEERRRWADAVIDNGGDEAALRRQVRRIWETLLVPRARALTEP